MKRIEKIIVALLFIAAIPGTPIAQELKLIRGHVIKFKLDTVAAPTLSGTATMVLIFTPTFICGDATEVTLRIEKSENLKYLGPEPWSFPFDTTAIQTATFDIVIPPNDTSFIKVWMDCGRTADWAYKYFVTTGEKLEVWEGSPRGHPLLSKTDPANQRGDPIRDTMTVEQLQTEYKVDLDLRDPAHRKFAEKILGPLPDSCERKDRKSVYILYITLDNAFKLDNEGIHIDRVRTKEAKPNLDSVPPKKLENDSLKQQGNLESTLNHSSPDGASSDYADGISSSGQQQTSRGGTELWPYNTELWLDHTEGLISGSIPIGGGDVEFWIGMETDRSGSQWGSFTTVI